MSLDSAYQMKRRKTKKKAMGGDVSPEDSDLFQKNSAAISKRMMGPPAEDQSPEDDMTGDESESLERGESLPEGPAIEYAKGGSTDMFDSYMTKKRLKKMANGGLTQAPTYSSLDQFSRKNPQITSQTQTDIATEIRNRGYAPPTPSMELGVTPSSAADWEKKNPGHDYNDVNPSERQQEGPFANGGAVRELAAVHQASEEYPSSSDVEENVAAIDGPDSDDWSTSGKWDMLPPTLQDKAAKHFGMSTEQVAKIDQYSNDPGVGEQFKGNRSPAFAGGGMIDRIMKKRKMMADGGDPDTDSDTSVPSYSHAKDFQATEESDVAPPGEDIFENNSDQIQKHMGYQHKTWLDRQYDDMTNDPMNKKKMAKGGGVSAYDSMNDTLKDENAGVNFSSPSEPTATYARGGDILKRAMAKCRYSKGGMIANEDRPIADSLPAEYDDLALRDDLESSYTGANSGDEIGNSGEDMRRKDIISRILRSRMKRDRMPSPA